MSTAVEPSAVDAEPSTVQVLQHDGEVMAVVFSPDGRLLATASVDKTARIWEVATGTLQHTLRHDGRVRGVAFSPDGRLLATTSRASASLWALVR